MKVLLLASLTAFSQQANPVPCWATSPYEIRPEDIENDASFYGPGNDVYMIPFKDNTASEYPNTVFSSVLQKPTIIFGGRVYYNAEQTLKIKISNQ